MKENIYFKDYFQSYRKRLNNLLENVDYENLEKIITVIINCFQNGNTLYICGNGGSAATASHMHADFTFFTRHFTKFRPKIRALTDNVPIITAIGNDLSFNEIFTDQLKGNFETGDVLICISASGNSENTIKAAQFEVESGGVSIAIVGFTGGKLLEISTFSVFTPNSIGDYGPVEDIHMILDHVIVNYLSRNEVFLSIPPK